MLTLVVPYWLLFWLRLHSVTCLYALFLSITAIWVEKQGIPSGYCLACEHQPILAAPLLHGSLLGYTLLFWLDVETDTLRISHYDCHCSLCIHVHQWSISHSSVLFRKIDRKPTHKPFALPLVVRVICQPCWALLWHEFEIYGTNSGMIGYNTWRTTCPIDITVLVILSIDLPSLPQYYGLDPYIVFHTTTYYSSIAYPLSRYVSNKHALIFMLLSFLYLAYWPAGAACLRRLAVPTEKYFYIFLTLPSLAGDVGGGSQGDSWDSKARV